eukprot:11597843-Alexandrium_andersonii.AAC.1
MSQLPPLRRAARQASDGRGTTHGEAATVGPAHGACRGRKGRCEGAGHREVHGRGGDWGAHPQEVQGRVAPASHRGRHQAHGEGRAAQAHREPAGQAGLGHGGS